MDDNLQLDLFGEEEIKPEKDHDISEKIKKRYDEDMEKYKDIPIW